MEISKIAIKNFKGIENIEMGPVKPINVLIGRNNSGKSSILACLQFLHEYFNAVDPKKPGRGHSSSIAVRREYFRKWLGENPQFGVSITVAQTLEERKEQFDSAVEAWNKQYDRPRMSPEATDVQLANDLFSTLTFDLVAKAPQGPLGLVSISTAGKSSDGNMTEIKIAESPGPGSNMARLPLRNLFTEHRNSSGSCQTVFELKEKVGFKDGLEIGYTTGGLSPNKEPIFLQHLIFPSFQYLRKKFDSTFLLGPYRHGRIVAGADVSSVLDSDASRLVNYIDYLDRNYHTTLIQVADFVRRIVPEVGRLHTRYVGESGANLELAYDWPDGTTINLQNMGGGVEQLLILGCLLLHQKTSCILWEEPESHLHPGAQDLLLNELEKLVGDSIIFLTTHSPVFIRPSEKIAIHAITNQDGKSATGRTLSETDLQEAVAMLGSRPGHIAQADIVVYVEGPYGAAVIEEWIKKWPGFDDKIGHLRLMVQPIPADDLASDEYNLVKLKKVSPYTIIFVDKDSDEDEPKAARKKLQDKCGKLGIPCIITEERQIENYLPEEYFEKFWSSQLWENWKKDKKFTAGMKKHNREIAAAMDWGQVEKHKDIMKVFAEIAKYADRLKPQTDIAG